MRRTPVTALMFIFTMRIANQGWGLESMEIYGTLDQVNSLKPDPHTQFLTYLRRVDSVPGIEVPTVVSPTVLIVPCFPPSF